MTKLKPAPLLFSKVMHRGALLLPRQVPPSFVNTPLPILVKQKLDANAQEFMCSPRGESNKGHLEWWLHGDTDQGLWQQVALSLSLRHNRGKTGNQGKQSKNTKNQIVQFDFYFGTFNLSFLLFVKEIHIMHAYHYCYSGKALASLTALTFEVRQLPCKTKATITTKV